MLSALGVLILLLGSVITVLDLTMVGISSLLIFFAVIEIGGAYPYLIWLVTGVLSLLLLPDKFSALLYLLFGGVYPIFKAMFERLHYIVAWVLKLSFFNSVLLLLIALCNNVFMLPETGLGFTLPVFAVCNLAFVLYDYFIAVMVRYYMDKLRPRFRNLLK